MKHSPEEIKKRREARNIQVTIGTDPAERAKHKEERKAYLLLDDGTDLIVSVALYAIADGVKRGRKRNLLNVVAKLCSHLTPEQQLGLAERLPDVLSREALAALAERATARLKEPADAAQV
jgi:hypothetical protein